MIKFKNTTRLAVLSIVAAMLLSGCTLIKFRTSEEIKKTEELEQDIAVKTEKVSANDMADDDLLLDRSLTNSLGSVLAKYKAVVPQFITSGARSTVFKRLNDYYKGELEACEYDCDSYLGGVKESYGASFDQATESSPRGVSFDYRLVDCFDNDTYISILRTYTVTAADGSHVDFFSGDVFWSETGWQLKFSDLFGASADKATEIVYEKVTSWCDISGIPSTGVKDIPIDTLTSQFVLSKKAIVLLLDPFTLTSNDGVSRMVEIPLSEMEDILVNKTPTTNN